MFDRYTCQVQLVSRMLSTFHCCCTCLHAGVGKLEVMQDSSADVIGLDWSTSMTLARQTLGSAARLQGNVDPMVLFGPPEAIEAEVNRVLLEAGPQGHILNVGHGVVQGTPEENVKFFCDLARQSAALFEAQQQQPRQQGQQQQQQEALHLTAAAAAQLAMTR